MKLQVLHDNFGNDTGVFVPMEDWNIIKREYPDIEFIDEYVPMWEKDLIDDRLNSIRNNPERLKSGNEFMKELKKEI